jgi:hypothetical protein
MVGSKAPPMIAKVKKIYKLQKHKVNYYDSLKPDLYTLLSLLKLHRSPMSATFET